MSQGWVKLHRVSNFHKSLQSERKFYVFIKCLLDANYKEEEYRGVKIKPGEFTTSYRAFAKRHNLKEGGAVKALKALAKDSILKLESTPQYTKITVLNWERYQSEEQDRNSSNTVRGARRNTNKKKEERNKKKEIIYTPKLKTCDFFADPELNEWIGEISDYLRTQWHIIGEPHEIEPIAYEAREWQLNSGKKYKSIASFFNNWLKRTDLYSQRMHAHETVQKLKKYQSKK